MCPIPRQIVIGIGQLAASAVQLAQAKGGAAKIFQLLDKAPEIPVSGGEVPTETMRGAVSFKEVHFAYPTSPQQPVLRGLSFSVPGEPEVLEPPSSALRLLRTRLTPAVVCGQPTPPPPSSARADAASRRCVLSTCTRRVRAHATSCLASAPHTRPKAHAPHTRPTRAAHAPRTHCANERRSSLSSCASTRRVAAWWPSTATT